MELEQFRAKATPAKRKSRLDAFHEEIATLRQDGYSLRQVCEFLESKQCKVTPQALNEWIKRRGIEEAGPVQNRRATDSQVPEKRNPPAAGGVKSTDKENVVEPTPSANKPAVVKKTATQEELKQISRTPVDLSQYEDDNS